MRKRRPTALPALLLSAALLLPASAAGEEPASHWGIQFMGQADWKTYLPMEMRTEEGYTVEYRIEQGIIRPDEPLTGGLFSEMVLRALFPGELAAAQGETADQRAIAVAQSAGLLEGTGITAAGPVTRYEAAVLALNALARYQVYPEHPEQAQGRIGDFDAIPEVYRTAVSGIYTLGLAVGKDSDGSFCGGDALTLAESCVLAGRMRDQLEQRLDLMDVPYSFWKETPDGPQLFTGLWAGDLPLPAEEAVQTTPELEYAAFDSLDGGWLRRTWPGLEVDCFRYEDGSELLCRLALTMPGFSTFHGISVGSTVEHLLTAYQDYGWIGEEEDGTFYFVPEAYWGTLAPNLRFTVEEGLVTAIEMTYYYPKGS